MDLSQTNQAVRAANPTTTAAFLNLVRQNPFTTGNASTSDVLTFVGLARAACDGGHQGTKRRAMDVLVNISTGANSPYFPRLNINQVVYDLVLRILEPRLIRQGGFGLCGPASFAVMIAKTDPVAYAKLAHDLLTGGKATVKFLRIEPCETVRNYDPADETGPADWLVLASIRNSDNIVADDLSHYGGTTIFQMFDWLRDLGYPTVVSLCLPTRWGPDPAMWKSMAASVATKYHPRKPKFLDAFPGDALSTPIVNLDLASRLLDSGWRVLLQVTEKMAATVGANDPVQTRVFAATQAYTNVGQAVPPDAAQTARRLAIASLVGSEGSNHWVLAKEIIMRDDGKIQIRRYSFGTKDITAPLERNLFFSIYGGFVAASERDIDS
jgi:hypothetical protein